MNIQKLVVYVIVFVAVASGFSALIHLYDGGFIWYVIAGQWAEILASFAEKFVSD